jgi:D-serine deaminase-like pyridoxal phosphate-dependent protein
MTTAACTANLAEERKVWRQINAWRGFERFEGGEMAGFQAKPRGNNLKIWDCIVPGKRGTIFADGRFPVVLDFRNSAYGDLPPVHVPEEFGSKLEKYFQQPDDEFGGVKIYCSDRVWSAYERALSYFVPPNAPDASIRTILLKVQESKFTSFENYFNEKEFYRNKEEWTHIIAKYVPKVDEKRGGGSPNAVLPTTATSAVSSKRTRKENHRNATTIRREVPKELWEEQAFNWGDYCVVTTPADDIVDKITREYPNLRTPCLCLDWDQVAKNVEAMLRLVKCVENWRPHVKTTKMTLVWNLLLEKGVFKFKCSTIKELHYLLATIEHYEVAKQKKETTTKRRKKTTASTKQKDALKYDVLYAHPLVSKEQCEDVRTLAMEYRMVKINVLIEAAPRLKDTTLLKLFRDNCLVDWTSMQDDTILPNVGFFLDFSNGFDRTGFSLLDPSEVDKTFFEELMSHAWSRSRFSGLSVYEGHIDDCVGYDKDKLKAREMKWNIADEAIVNFLKFHREQQSSKVGKKMIKTAEPIEVVTSGTPSFIHALDKYLNMKTGKMDRHEGTFYGRKILRTVSPGTVVFFDHRSHTQICQQMHDKNIYLRPALYVAATVVSKPGKKNDRMFTCNAGSKSIAAEAGSPIAIVAASTGKFLLESMTETFWKQTKCSEEHLTFEVVRNFIEDGGAPPPIEKGETIFMVPRHVCPTVNLHECINLLSYDDARNKCFIHRAKIDARGHYMDPVENHLDELCESFSLSTTKVAKFM